MRYSQTSRCLCSAKEGAYLSLQNGCSIFRIYLRNSYIYEVRATRIRISVFFQGASTHPISFLILHFIWDKYCSCMNKKMGQYLARIFRFIDGTILDPNNFPICNQIRFDHLVNFISDWILSQVTRF